MSRPEPKRRPGSAHPPAKINPRRPGAKATPWTRPITGSPYPLTFVASTEDPKQGAVRVMGVISAILILGAFAFIVPVVNTGVVAVGYFLTPNPGEREAFGAACTAFESVWGVWASHIGIASMIIVAWLYYRYIHHRHLPWLWSVSRGVRVRFGIVSLLVALVVVGAVALFRWLTGPGWAPIAGWGWYALAIILTTPFQALAEEVVFRGYLMQALGGIVRNVWFPIIGSALCFALFHGSQNPWLFASRFVFGLAAGILVWRTGGLESAVAIHLVNNLFAFAIAILSGTLSEIRMTTAVDWTQAAADAGMFIVCAGACIGIAIGMRVPRLVGTSAKD